MWLPDQLADQARSLRAAGLTLDPTALGDPLRYPLGSVVSLGGCSASFVSGDGLIITNHHCAISALQTNATPERNLIQLGFLARSPAQELWNGPTSRVYITQRLRDVTADVRAGLTELASDRERFDAVEKRTKELVADCERGRFDVRCSVASAFGGGRYTVVEQLELRDVRLVYAPHGQIGDYGGEIDNWRWPRYTGDFAFFRAYVGRDGKAADHDAANVPYHPPQHLTLADRPLRAGDFVMVAGYPGNTSRLRTAGEVDEAVSWTFPHNIERAETYLAALEQLNRQDARRLVKTTPTIRGLSNQLLKARGVMQGLVNGGLLATRQKDDDALAAWIDADPTRRARDGDLFGALAAQERRRRLPRAREAAWGEALQFSRLLGAAATIVRMAEERPKADAERDPAYQERNWKRLTQAQTQMQKLYDRDVDRALLKLALQRALRLTPADRPELVGLLLAGATPDIVHVDAAVDALYAGTHLGSEAERIDLLDAAPARVNASADAFIKLARAMRPFQKALEDASKEIDGALTLLRPRYINAWRAFSPRPLAPDANGTLRITYGTVRPYRPTPQSPEARPFTVLAGVVARHTGHDPFDCPAPLLAAARERRFGAYADAALGDVPVDFLSDLDITNGNSGSPTLNDRGQLVGLAFDGNVEGVASDWLFVPALTRTIHVDIRYVLWVADVVDGAHHLVSELTTGRMAAPR